MSDWTKILIGVSTVGSPSVLEVSSQEEPRDFDRVACRLDWGEVACLIEIVVQAKDAHIFVNEVEPPTVMARRELAEVQ